jgi:tRNA/rRNA methyltransferase
LLEYVVVLVEPQFESTIGFFARAMKNFDLQELRLVNPVADIGGEARMRASHAQDVLDNARAFSSLGEALARTDVSIATTAQRTSLVHKISRKPVTSRELAGKLAGVRGTAALVFGREGTGLNNSEIGLCDLTLTLSASPAYPTLNISHAAAIIFHQLYTSSSDRSGELLAGAEVKRRILGFLKDSLDSLDLPNHDKALVAKAFKTLMGRSSIRAREASLLAGFFRKTSNRLRREWAVVKDEST